MIKNQEEEKKINSLVDLRRLFHTMDEDDSGTIGVDELMKAVDSDLIDEAIRTSARTSPDSSTGDE